MFDWFPQYEYQLASAQLAFAMLGMGALLGPRDFVEVVRSPRALSIGLVIQLGVAPLVAFALGITLFFLTLIMNIFALYIVRKYREQYE